MSSVYKTCKLRNRDRTKQSPTDIFLRVQNVHKHKDDCTKIIMFTDLWRLWFEANSSASEYYKSEIVAITDQPVCPRPGYDNRIDHQQLVSRQRKEKEHSTSTRRAIGNLTQGGPGLPRWIEAGSLQCSLYYYCCQGTWSKINLSRMTWPGRMQVAHLMWKGRMCKWSHIWRTTQAP